MNGKLQTDTMMVERIGIFDKDYKKRFELSFTIKDSQQKKSILVICLNPASGDIRMLDTTTTFILNNLIPMGYTTITICNLYSHLFKQRLKPSKVPDNNENRKYLKEVLNRSFDNILIGYGNTFVGNKCVNEEKKYLQELLSNHKDKVVDLVDDAGEYERLTTIHPLMAGRYFPNKWKLRPLVFREGDKEEEKKKAKKASGKKKIVAVNIQEMGKQE